MALTAGCASSNTSPEWEPLKASVEALYLNYQELRILHSDLHAAELSHIEASGSQLPEIQSAARFIQQANLIAFYQWELLSITHYIDADARRDFFTLRERDLRDARDRTKDLVLATKVYEAFIQDPQARELIDTCLQRIQQHIDLYEQMALELGRLNGSQVSIDRQSSPTFTANVEAYGCHCVADGVLADCLRVRSTAATMVTWRAGVARNILRSDKVSRNLAVRSISS